LDKEPDICIGSFRAASKFIWPGERNEYFVELTNCNEECIRAHLVFDIYRYYSTKAARHPEDHHAYFSKWIDLNPQSSELKIEYNWGDNIKFIMNESIESYDDKWIGPMNQEGLYSIHLVLMKEVRNQELVIFQELRPMDNVKSAITEMFNISKIFDINDIIYGFKDVLSNVGDRNLIFIGGDDIDKIKEIIEYFFKYNRTDLILYIQNKERINADFDDKSFILANDKITHGEALKKSILMCDPSNHVRDLTGILNAWLNGIPILVNENSILREICMMTNSGLSFRDYDEFKSCLDFYISNPKERKAIGNNNMQLGIEMYYWLRFLKGLSDYIDSW
jgi:hypothetical protein